MNLALATRTFFALALVMASLAAPTARAEWVDWIAEAEIGFEYNDNLSLSAFQGNDFDDFSWHPLARLGRTYQATDRTRVSLAARLGGDIYAQFSGLDAVEVGGELAVIHKFGVGNAPWVRWSGFAGYKHVDDFQRSGERAETGIFFGKRFSPRFDAALGYTFTHNGGHAGTALVPTISSEVFDLQFHTLTLNGNFLLLPDLLLRAGYAFRGGEIASHCSVANVGTVLAVENVKAIHLDGLGTDTGVFGGCVYRLDTHGHAAKVALNYGLTDHIAIEAGYRFQFGKAKTLSYKNNSGFLSLMYRY